MAKIAKKNLQFLVVCVCINLDKGILEVALIL